MACIVLLAAADGSAVAADGSPVAGKLQAGMRAAEHHLHIRSAAGAEVARELQLALGEPGAEETTEPTTASTVIQALDAAGIERGLVLSLAYMYGAPDISVDDERDKVRAENDYVAAQVADYSDRLVAACSVNPLAEYALDEIERCAADPRIGAFKLHLANSGVDLHDSEHVVRLAAVFEALGRRELPAVVHVRTRNPEYGSEDVDIFVREVMSRAQGLPVQIAHMGGWGGYDAQTDAVLEAFADALADGRLDRDLITLDLAAVVFQPAAAGADTVLARTVREANARLSSRIRQIGVDRIVFATDWPAWPPTRDPRLKLDQYARLVAEELSLTPQELTQIFNHANSIVRGRQ